MSPVVATWPGRGNLWVCSLPGKSPIPLPRSQMAAAPKAVPPTCKSQCPHPTALPLGSPQGHCYLGPCFPLPIQVRGPQSAGPQREGQTGPAAFARCSPLCSLGSETPSSSFPAAAGSSFRPLLGDQLLTHQRKTMPFLYWAVDANPSPPLFARYSLCTPLGSLWPLQLVLGKKIVSRFGAAGSKRRDDGGSSAEGGSAPRGSGGRRDIHPRGCPRMP